MADRVAILRRGVLQDVGTPAEVYGRPATLYVAAFLGTRAFAVHSRAVNAADAGTWFDRGRNELALDHVDAAVDAFRRALAKSKDNRVYSLALARALERHRDSDAAERALLALRDTAPEDGEVNLELARIAARRSDLPAALRYYRDALYAPVAASDENIRRGVRFELITFLLSHGDKSRALSELLIAANDAPPDVAAAMMLGALFSQAGDLRRARDEYLRAVRLEPRNGAALAGAGTAAFALGNYAEARQYLDQAPADDPAIASMREIADHVLSDDPLGMRISVVERYRRLVADLSAVSDRLHSCLARAPSADVDAATKSVDGFAMRLRSRRADPDTLDAGLSVVFKGELAVPSSCGEPSPRDKALVLIARAHGADGA